MTITWDMSCTNGRWILTKRFPSDSKSKHTSNIFVHTLIATTSGSRVNVWEYLLTPLDCQLIDYNKWLLFSKLISDPFRESDCKVDELSSFELKRTLFIMVGHNLAHHWLGDLVTFNNWTSVWFYESLAITSVDDALVKVRASKGILLFSSAIESKKDVSI